MLENLLIAGALALVQPYELAEAPYDHPHVKQVTCSNARGTAWRLSKGRFVSVSHVTRHPGCKVNGLPIIVEHDDPFGDFSIIRVPGDNVKGGIPVNCQGFAPGQWYYSVGFARGNWWSVVISLKSVAWPNWVSLKYGWSMFKGIEYMIPGMSGGVVLNAAGEGVGTVNAYNDIEGLSWSRSLSQTALCRG